MIGAVIGAGDPCEVEILQKDGNGCFQYTQSIAHIPQSAINFFDSKDLSNTAAGWKIDPLSLADAITVLAPQTFEPEESESSSNESEFASQIKHAVRQSFRARVKPARYRSDSSSEDSSDSKSKPKNTSLKNTRNVSRKGSN